MRYEDILYFWFHQRPEKAHWQKDPRLDAVIRILFGDIYQHALAGELGSWRRNIRGRLAEIIILDQFSRHMFRDDKRSFQADPLALILAQEAWATGSVKHLPPMWQTFAVMPFMHSESAAIHVEALKIFQALDEKSALAFEQKHKDIIDCFGRYPHRNKILNRPSTPRENAFLKQPGSHF